jgi:hypothetical protein
MREVGPPGRELGDVVVDNLFRFPRASLCCLLSLSIPFGHTDPIHTQSRKPEKDCER